MASDVLVDSRGFIQPHMSTDNLSSSDSDDAVNTDFARVHFGPLKSPEKKLTIAGDSANFVTPVKRSNRASSVPTSASEYSINETREEQEGPELEDTREQMEALESSREGTPLHLDEPSSLLASRILRAHDNPSPPPESPIFEALERRAPPSKLREGILVDISDPMAGTVEDKHGHLSPFMTPVIGLVNMLSSPFAPIFTPPRASPFDGGMSEGSFEHNLIDLDSSAALSPHISAPSSTPLPSSEKRDGQIPQIQSSALDTLTTSPLASTSNNCMPSIQYQSPSISMGSSESSTDEEKQVLHALAVDEQSNVSRYLSRREHSALSQTQPDIAKDVASSPHRRSTRPRRTSSPLRPSAAEASTASVSPQKLRRSPRRSRSPSKGPIQMTKKNHSGLVSPSIGLGTASQNETASPRDTCKYGAAGDPEELQVSKEPNRELLIMTSPLSKSSSPPVTPRTRSITDFQSNSGLNANEHLSVISSPARRVPISSTIRDGPFSAQKLSSLAPKTHVNGKHTASSSTAGPLRSPFFKRLALDDPARSPAKRVPLSETRPIPWVSPLKGNSATGNSRRLRAMSEDKDSVPLVTAAKTLPARRSASEEPTTSVIPQARLVRSHPQRPSNLSADAPASSDAQQKKSRTALPFPITAAPTRLPLSIPEADEGDHEPQTEPAEQPRRPSPGKSSPKAKSTLRAPSSRATSRIPRVGVKPYSRPQPPGTAQNTKLPSSTTTLNGNARPLRIVKLASSSGSSSDESGAQASRSSVTTLSKVSALSQGIKRKREGEQSTSPPRPARPMTMMRKVVSTAPKSQALPSLPQGSTTQSAVEHSTAKPRGPIKMRRVQDWIKPAEERNVTLEDPPQPGQTDKNSQPSSVDSAATGGQGTPPAPDIAPLSLTSSHPGQSSEPHSGLLTPDLDQQTQDMSPRRITRSSKFAEFEASSSSVAGPSVTKTKPRRKHTPSNGSSLAGMSALALKTLTISNTSKNQKQVAELQTEVIRREGKRPDSPTTKVRSALEEQKEARDQERRERAERRAKRLGREGDAVNGYEPSDIGDSSMISEDLDVNGNPLKHRRGPGDEEDYVTPERPARPPKKGRLDEDMENNDRRVKWDRGLVTTVFLDGSPPKPRHQRGIVAMKGCLTPNAKVVRLDTLGNVLDVDAPLTNLIREQVVVKKFVYDEELEPEPEKSPAVKSAKGKGKKSKQ